MDLNELMEGYRQVAIASCADATDKVVGRRCYMEHAIKPRINDSRVAGPAVTVLEVPTEETVPPTHALDLIDQVEAGSVICIAAGGEPDVAVWGGLMTAGAVANGLAGAVLDGAVRDVAEIRRDFGFPVFARSASPGTTLGRYKTIDSQVTVRVGGILVAPGDIVVGDVDGVVVVPRAKAAEVLELAREIDRREAEQTRLILEKKSLREGLAAYGRI